jgi:hypothetical protein
MNDNLRKMRAALSNYHKAALTAEQQIKKISEEMKPAIAAQMIQQIRSELTASRAAAIDHIHAAAKSGISDAEKWGMLNPADLTDDVKLLQSGIKLTQKEYDNLCQKYQNNGSMSRVLDEYADQRNRENKNGIDGLLLKVYLSTVEKKAEPWNRLERSAERIMVNIDGKGFAMGADNPLVADSVNQFGSTMPDLYN